MLKEIMQECTFTDTGVLVPSSAQVSSRNVYRFMHQAIADDHLPVYKVIGFKLTSSVVSKGIISVAERNLSVLENNIEIYNNLESLVFMEELKQVAAVVEHIGALDLNTPNNVIMCAGKYPRILYKNEHILTSLNNVTLQLKVGRGSGYSSMAETAERLNDSSFFPMAVRFSIHDYCRVCPPRQDGFVEYRLSGGMTGDDVRARFLELYGRSSQLNKEDTKWLLNCDQWQSETM